MAPLAILLLAFPAVVLSDEHQTECKVGVGDAFPAITASTSTGRAAAIADQLGEKGTIVAVHHVEGGWMTEELLADLSPEIVTPYAARGISVIAVGVDRVAPTKTGVTSLKASETNIGSQLGDGRMPRVYALDPDGKIVWFDIEYSLSTRRELKACVEKLASAEGPDDATTESSEAEPAEAVDPPGDE